MLNRKKRKAGEGFWNGERMDIVGSDIDDDFEILNIEDLDVEDEYDRYSGDGHEYGDRDEYEQDRDEYEQDRDEYEEDRYGSVDGRDEHTKDEHSAPRYAENRKRRTEHAASGRVGNRQERAGHGAAETVAGRRDKNVHGISETVGDSFAENFSDSFGFNKDKATGAGYDGFEYGAGSFEKVDFDYGMDIFGKAGYEEAGHEAAEYEEAGHEAAEYEEAGHEAAEYEEAGREAAEYEEAGHEAAEYGEIGHEETEYGEAGYEEAEYGEAEYGEAGYDDSEYYAEDEYDEEEYGEDLYDDAGYAEDEYEGAAYDDAGHAEDGYEGAAYDEEEYADDADEGAAYDEEEYADDADEGAAYDEEEYADDADEGAAYDEEEYADDADEGAAYDDDEYVDDGYEGAAYDDNEYADDEDEEAVYDNPDYQVGYDDSEYENIGYADSDYQESADTDLAEMEEDGEEDEEEEPVKEKSVVRELLNMVLYLGGVLLITFLILTFVGQRTEVSGESMQPTLNNEDNLIVDKISYRFRDPERFDIIVFPYEQEKNTYYIKRIIGLPGESVRIDESGSIYINGEVLDESYGAETIADPGVASTELVLGDDEYFVLGDNRNYSKDSRDSSVGNIKGEKIVGRAWLRIYPFSDFGILKHQ